MGRKSRAKAVRRAERERSLLTQASMSARWLDPRAETEVAGVTGLTQAEVTPLPIPRTGVVVRVSSWASPTPSGSTRGVSAVEIAQPTSESVGRLVALADPGQALERALCDEVRRLRQDGISWTTIGRALNLTRQGARQRYSCSADGVDQGPGHQCEESPDLGSERRLGRRRTRSWGLGKRFGKRL